MQYNIKIEHALGWYIKKSGVFFEILALVSKIVD